MRKNIRTGVGAGCISLALVMSVFAVASVGSDAAEAAEAAEDGYVLRGSDGRVGIYNTDGELLKMTDIELGSLPSADRESLLQGIFTNNKQELAQLLEDLGS